MSETNPHLADLRNIKQMMEQSSQFISLSGFSGIAAGCCALAAAWYTPTKVECLKTGDCSSESLTKEGSINLQSTLLQIGLVTFAAALLLAFIFTYLRSKKTDTPIWNYAAKKVMINVAIPMIVGGLFMYRIMELSLFELLAPASLIFYGLALVNGSKYTLGEVRYLGYGQIILGVVCCWALNYGLYFWAAGFGILHIIYGALMWYKYERA